MRNESLNFVGKLENVISVHLCVHNNASLIECLCLKFLTANISFKLDSMSYDFFYEYLSMFLGNINVELY
jgi:hypothetical protein